MKKQIAIGLVILLLMTMIVPVQTFAEVVQAGEIFFKLDDSVQSLTHYQDYTMSVGFDNTNYNYYTSGNIFNFESYRNYNYQLNENITLNIEVSGGDLVNPVTFSQVIDTTLVKAQTCTIYFDPSAADNKISVSFNDLPIDVTFGHETWGYNINYSYEGSHIIYSDRAIDVGNYDVYYTKYDGENIYVAKESMNVDGTQNQIVSTVADPTTPYVVLADLSAYSNANINVVDGNNIPTSLSNASMLYMDVPGVSLAFGGNRSGQRVQINIPLPLVASSIDLTTLTATGRDNTARVGYVEVNELYSFTDANGNPVELDYTQLGSYTFEIAGNTINGPFNGGWLNLGNQSGTGNLTLNIPELGITNAVTTVTLTGGTSNGGGQSNTSDYVDYEFEITDPFTHEAITGTFATYDAATNNVYAFMPEDTNATFKVTGVKADGTKVAMLPLSFDSSEHPQYSYEDTFNAMILGNAQGGYGDMWFGMIEDHTRINLNVYKGVLGILTLENLESTPENPSYFEGEVLYGVGYQLANGSGSGSMSNGTALEGKLFIPVQEASLGVDYMYVVASPTKGNSTMPQANTEFLELSDKLGNSEGGFVDLGTAKFQTPTFKGTVLDQSGASVDGLFITSWTAYEGTELGLNSIFYTPAVVADDQGNYNTFYLAPLNHSFSNLANLTITSFNNAIKRITGVYDMTSGDTNIQEAKDQIEITMMTPDGTELMAEGSGLDRTISGYDANGTVNYATTNQSTTRINGFIEGETYTLQIQPDMGDFDHLYYVNGPSVTFTYTETEGDYTATDITGANVPFTVDANGLMHLSLKVGSAQVYGQLLVNGQPYDDQIEMVLYDVQTGERITSGMSHTSGGYNGQPVKYGVYALGCDTQLSGDYKLVISDPTSTVAYSGTSQIITLPLSAPLNIELPKSKIYGNVVISAEDQTQYNNNISRVYVNIFDASGQFVKNVLVRRDGVFSAGELEDGKYFAKVFVSPFSTLSEKYTSSKMNIFTVDNASEASISFNAPLIRVIGEGRVVTPTDENVSEAWVKIYNAQGVEVEAVKTNDQGVYKMPLLADGTYYLRALAADGYKDSIKSEIVIANQQVSGDMTLALTETQISGQVINTENTPISGVTVVLFDKDKNVLSIENSTEGTYSFGGLVAGDYYVQARAAEGSNYVDGELVPVTFAGSLVTEDLTLESAYYDGTVVTPQNAAIKKGWVHVYENDAYLKSVAIDENGHFKLEGFENPNQVKIVAEDGTGSFMASEAGALSDRSQVSLTVRANVGLKGTLKYGSEVLSKTKFYVYDASGNALYQGATSVFGEFTLMDVAHGKYTIVVPTASGYMIGSVEYTTEGQVVENVSLTKGE